MKGSVTECHEVSLIVNIYFCALYPFSSLHFDFSPLRPSPHSFQSVFHTEVLLGVAYVYFDDAKHGFFVDCSLTAKTFQLFVSAVFSSAPLFPPSPAPT